MRSAGHNPRLTPVSPQRWQQFRLNLLSGADNGLAAWSELGVAHDLSVRDPTRDRRLVELCWSLPDEIFWAHGRRRGLVRCGLHDRLPREVLDCARKGLQSSDIRQRLQDCRDDFLGQVDEVCRHPLAREWIDTERLAACAREIVDGERTAPDDSAPVTQTLRALAAGMFVVRSA